MITIIILLSLALLCCIAVIIMNHVKNNISNSKAFEDEKAELKEENRHVFDEIKKIRDIIASAKMGTWTIELVEGEEPRMYVDDTMKELLGIAGQERSPEKTYVDWFSNVKPEAVPSVLASVDRMKQGCFDENTYLWLHPTKGEHYVRCGGTSKPIPGGFSLRGYHYDVDDVVREEQARVAMLKQALDDKNEYYSTIDTIASIFNSMHVINLVEDTVVELKTVSEVKEIVNHKNGAVDMMSRVMAKLTTDEYKELALEFTDLTTLSDRMKGKKLITAQLKSITIGWFIASFIVMETDDEDRPVKVIYTTRSNDEEERQKNNLIYKSQTDELTGLLNRRAYEEDIYAHNDVTDKDEYIYMSLDVNGLKSVNDTYGHSAGDELLVGACQCMKNCLGTYGKLYRTGGDEFIAILFCSEEKLEELLNDFEETMAEWSGKMIDSLSISYGWISKNENPVLSVREMGLIADQRMYECKAEHYHKAGIDRRGQLDAHKALYRLYTKILKINITDDSYKIINMDTEEQTIEKGYSNKLSEWFDLFGKSGWVHPDDLEEYLKVTDLQYLKKYFLGKKTSLHLFYRRKYGELYKQVMMEIIPANDYSDNNQTLFLYVKDIDK